MTFCLLQGQYLEGGQRGGAWLGGDHSSESCHRPRPDVVVVRAHWHTQKNANGHTRFQSQERNERDMITLTRLPVTLSSPDTRCFSDSMIFVTGLLCTVNVWKSWGPDPTVSGCCTITLTAPLLVPYAISIQFPLTPDSRERTEQFNVRSVTTYITGGETEGVKNGKTHMQEYFFLCLFVKTTIEGSKGLLTGFWCEVDRQCSDSIIWRIVIKLRH